jgi:hypothetical protein
MNFVIIRASYVPFFLIHPDILLSTVLMHSYCAFSQGRRETDQVSCSFQIRLHVSGIRILGVGKINTVYFLLSLYRPSVLTTILHENNTVNAAENFMYLLYFVLKCLQIHYRPWLSVIAQRS